ncbi:MAG: hypothetical protein U0892_23535 [Pirellulales bacterium]
MILLTHHNRTFYQLVTAEARRQIAAGNYSAWLEQIKVQGDLLR